VGAQDVFKVGDNYVVPIEASPGGTCNNSGGVYLAILAEDGYLEISPYLALHAHAC
jgi:hypothetical protein